VSHSLELVLQPFELQHSISCEADATKDWVVLKTKKIIFTEPGVINFNGLKEMALKLPPAIKFYI